MLNKKWQVKCFDSIVNNLLKKKIGEEETTIWACRKLIILSKVLIFNDAQDFVKDAMILLVCSLNERSINIYDNLGVNLIHLPPKDKKDCLIILRKEFIADDLNQKKMGGNAR